MAAKFELFRDKVGEYRWRLRHQNGNVIADSGEGYVKKADAVNGIESVKKNIAQANMKDLTSPQPGPNQDAVPLSAGIDQTSVTGPAEVKPELAFSQPVVPLAAESAKSEPVSVSSQPVTSAGVLAPEKKRFNNLTVTVIAVTAVAWFVICIGVLLAVTEIK